MAEATCPNCGQSLTEIASRRMGVDLECPSCGAGFLHFESPATDAAALDPAETVGLAGPSGTVFMPPRPPREPGGPPVTIRGQLVVRDGETAEDRYALLNGGTVVGRDRAEITVEDPTLSSSHFRIDERGGDFFLRDLDSSNGTYLNGHRVRTAKLGSGDEIRAGKTTFVFSILPVIPP